MTTANIANNEPVINLPSMYVNNLALTFTSTTALGIGTGQCRDSLNVYDITVSSALSISTAVNGQNGLDTGTIGNNKFYAVFVIADAQGYNSPAGLISLSGTAPIMPKGWSIFRRIGWVLTDGSAHILKFYQSGIGQKRYMSYDAPIAVTVTSSGTATSYTALDLSVAMPLTNFGEAQIYFKWTPNAAADSIKFQPTGATGDFWVDLGIVAAVAQDEVMLILPQIASSKPEISYKNSTASATLNAVNLMAYYDNL